MITLNPAVLNKTTAAMNVNCDKNKGDDGNLTKNDTCDGNILSRFNNGNDVQYWRQRQQIGC